MRTTKKPGQPIAGLATVTEITVNRGGRPRHKPTEITLEIKEGANLRRFRDAAGLTSGVFANALGISQSTLSNYESGFKRIPDYRIEPMSELLGMESWELRIIHTLPLNLKAA